ncbi:MAG TPA: SAM-dependent methyltransferase [Bacteroidales bacterium]|nr:SAM-dependent methyltransferase [Bacteroidales bacterium]
MSGTVYMIPVTLGDSVPDLSIPGRTLEITLSIRFFAVEDIRTARRWLRGLDRSFPVDETHFIPVGKHSDPAELADLFIRVTAGEDAGVMSEAGMPGLADPGNIVAAEAHRRGIKVVPLPGPSSVMLALVASGLNGQSFAFNGYLPVDSQGRRKAIRDLEKLSAGGQTQIFMETPYRNPKMIEDILSVCQPSTRLCIAANITLASEEIRTMAVSDWRSQVPDLDKRPAVFLIQAAKQ